MTFSNQEFGAVRTVTIGGEPWLVGKDVALALGYTNPQKAIGDHVDEEDKRQGDGVTIRDPIGREQHPTVINESGLYSLVMGSKLPRAKHFKRWVTAEVLPTIRKTGGYVNDEDAFVRTYLPNVGPEVKEPYNGNGAHCAPLQADRLSALHNKNAAADGRDP